MIEKLLRILMMITVIIFTGVSASSYAQEDDEGDDDKTEYKSGKEVDKEAECRKDTACTSCLK